MKSKQLVLQAWFKSRFSRIGHKLAKPFLALFLLSLAFDINAYRKRASSWKKIQKASQDKQKSTGKEAPAVVPLDSAYRMVDTVLRTCGALSGLLLTVFVHRASSLARGTGLGRLVQLEQANQEHDMVNFSPPSLSLLSIVTSPFRAVFDPVFFGAENIPESRPLLFVSNHTLMAFDFPLLLWYLRKTKGITLRALADHSHFEIPVNSELLRSVWGAVDGTRRNVDLLMQNGQCLMVYPGGAKEVFKTAKNAKYELMWGDRVGFAYMAIKHGCTIVPVVNYGSEDMLDIVADLPIGWLPIPFLWGSGRTIPIPLPNRKQAARIGFQFGKPIHTEQYKGQQEDADICKLVRDETKAAIEEGIVALKQWYGYIKSADSKGGVFGTSHQRDVSAVRNLARWIKNSSVGPDSNYSSHMPSAL